jgi:Rps23 Pro-64 3,4-dihydroxylase Tpa1-like proline 4-hydroxylase
MKLKKDKDIIIHNDFLEKQLIIDLKNIIRQRVNDFNWKTNLSWGQNIVKSSSQVSSFNLINEKKFYDEILNYYKDYLKNKNINPGIMYYIWNNLSYIPFHKDEHSVIASTIYLNDNWHEDYGGLFLYKTKNEIKAIVPEFNKCIINTNNIAHATTLITMNAPYRETLQLFFTK